MTGSGTNRQRILTKVSVLFFWLMFVPMTAISFGATSHKCSNGITAMIYTAEEIESNWLVKNEQSTLLQHPLVGTLELLNGVDDERLGRHVSRFYTYSEDVVAEVLSDMHGFQTDLVVNVFILPSLPVEPMSSFARRGVVYLAPGFGPIAESTQAYTLTHEIGHVLTWAFLDSHPELWETYLTLRDIDIATAGYAAPHADRAREIIAEDIRYLFGGALATESGSIENSNIVLPDQVSGLAETLASFFEEPATELGIRVTSRAFPNPCNPSSTVEVVFPVGLKISTSHGAKLRVFDIRGRLVRTVIDGELANNRIAFEWDSSAEDGTKVASGIYLFVISLGDITSQGRITVVR